MRRICDRKYSLIIVVLSLLWCSVANAAGERGQFAGGDTTLNTEGRKGVALVLSGGGAKGLSHIGVIRSLEENDIPIDYICGTSMGAIIAGLYAVGYSPDEMTALVKSKAFESWQRGMPEISYASNFYDFGDDPSLASVRLKRGPAGGDTTSRLRVVLPTSAVSPYPMDLAVMGLFASPAVATGNDFDSLMVPFFCVASDIVSKKPYIARRGDLGTAIRASMSIPLYFKPVVTDSMVLFDGGLNDNFPWKMAEEIFNPEFIIGAQCVRELKPAGEDDAISLGLNLLMKESDYNIPEEIGLLISGDYDEYGIMDFDKVDLISAKGYDITNNYIDSIKQRVKEERTALSVDSMRIAFKQKCKPIIFSDEIEVTGDLSPDGKRYIRRTIREDRRNSFDFDQLRRGYYRIVRSDVVNTLYPSYDINKSDSLRALGDSLIFLKIRASQAPPYKISLGGNISSSSLNQVYAGFSYLHAGMNPWRVKLGAQLGKFYRGGDFLFRHDIGVKPLAYYYVQAVAHQFDYYNGSQNLLKANKIPKNVTFKEFYGRIGIVTPLSLSKNITTEFAVVASRSYQRSFLIDLITSADIPDKGSVAKISPMLEIKSNTLDNTIYPTSGRAYIVRAQIAHAVEEFAPGSTNTTEPKETGRSHNIASIRAKGAHYFNFNKHLSLGISGDIVISTKSSMSNYYTALLSLPVYEPVSHATTLLLEGYRSYTFAGVAISPVIKFKSNLYLHGTVAYFRAHRRIVREEEGWQYSYSDLYPKGGVISNIALVWQSPIGQLSFSATYYSSGAHRWYPQVNFGKLLFNRKSGGD